jgi:predicted phage baseplate assembly protein
VDRVQDRPLDLRTFQDIVDEARRLIPRYCPEWTDHNLSDPGITLVELFAWMTEMILYQVNRVPDEMYERFLDMVGIRRRPPTPAMADVTFYLSAPLGRPVVIPAETEVATDRTETQEAIVFATTQPLAITTPALRALRAWREGQGFEDYLPYITSGLIEAPIFNEPPAEGDALYIGYAGNPWGYSLQLHLECEELEGSHIDPRDPPLLWEYWSGAMNDWAPVRLLDQTGTGRPRDPSAIDPTHGLNRSADVYLHIPLDSQPHVVDGLEATWIRLRYIEKEGQGYTKSPRIRGLRSEAIGATVPARQAHHIEGEFVGQSNGTADQSFSLRESPVLSKAEPHVIEAVLDEVTQEWLEVEDFSESGEQDRHFVLHYNSGEVRFGPTIRSRDGTSRQYGAIPWKGASLRMRSYHSGGGTAGNMGEGAISQLKSSIPYVASVMNYRPATGGLNEESLEQAKLRALRVLKRTDVAIAREDYERLAQEVEGVGRARCITPDQANGDLAPGTVRLLLVRQLPGPEEALAPEDLLPSPFLIRQVSSYLDERKSLGTIVQYGPVEFTWVEIDAHIYVKPGVDTAVAQAQAVRRLREFMHPVRGGPNGQGLNFGGAITVSQIAGLLQTMPEVTYVERVRLRSQGENRDVSRMQAPTHGLLALGHCYVLAEVVEG